MYSSKSIGAASAPAPKNCCGQAKCRRSPAWAIRSSRVMNPSVVSSMLALRSPSRIGDWVFVPGANCFADARGLFGGTAQRLIVPSARAFPVSESLGVNGVLYALAATAQHALAGGNPPDLIIGHGVLGRLLARLTIAKGAPPPVVWDNQACRRSGAIGYDVVRSRRRRPPRLPDNLRCQRIMPTGWMPSSAALAKGGEIVLAGFYAEPPQLRLRARLSERGAHARRRRMAGRRSRRRRQLIETRRARPCRPHFRHQARCRCSTKLIPQRCSMPNASRWFWTGVNADDDARYPDQPCATKPRSNPIRSTRAR